MSWTRRPRTRSRVRSGTRLWAEMFGGDRSLV